MSVAIPMVALVGALLVLVGVRDPRPARRRRRAHRGDPAWAVAAALAAASLTLLITTVPVAALLAAVIAARVPAMVRHRRAQHAHWQRALAWPAVLDDVTSAVRAGMDLPEALLHAGRHAPADMRPIFDAFAVRYARGADFVGSLDELRRCAGDPIVDDATRALAIARTVGGGDLTQVLRSLATYLRLDLQVRGEVRARQSWAVNSARMAVAAPWVVLTLLASRPSTMAAFRTGTGMAVLVGVAVSSALAYAVMLRIARLEEVPA